MPNTYIKHNTLIYIDLLLNQKERRIYKKILEAKGGLERQGFSALTAAYKQKESLTRRLFSAVHNSGFAMDHLKKFSRCS